MQKIRCHKLHPHLTKNDHIIIVGGPGNSLDWDLKSENDMDSIAKNSTHTNVGFVALVKCHNRPHTSK